MHWSTVQALIRNRKLAAATVRNVDRPEALGAQLRGLLGVDGARAAALEMLRPDRPLLEFDRDGTHWVVDIGDEIGSSVFRHGHYEGAEIAALLAWLGPADGRLVVDVGANVGTTTIPFAQAGFHVLAVEPVPETAELLDRNIAANDLGDRVDIRRVAVSDDPAVVMVLGTGSGQSEVATDNAPAFTRWDTVRAEVKVPAMRLDELASEAACVWCDAQGSETAVIETGAALWAAGTPLYAEIDPHSLELHGGWTRFVTAALDHFAFFSPASQIGSPRPISELDAWASTIGGYSDALLLPGGHSPNRAQ